MAPRALLRFLWRAAPVFLAGLTGCASGSLERHEFSAPAMGTEFRLRFYAESRALAEGAAAAAFACIHALDRALSDYDPGSELSRLGAASDGGAPTDWIPVSSELRDVLACAAEVSRASGGAFDVTVGPYSRLWRRARRQEELPPPARLAAAAAAVGPGLVELEPGGRRVRLLARGMRLDPGGIAKGYALDRALAVLAQHGIERALVEGGGDLVAGAAPPGEEGWPVGVAGLDSAEPARDPAGGHLRLAHAALATSGDLERFVELEGRRYSHIVDPRTGQALTERRLASVLAPDGMRADAWATALAVLGPEGLELIPRTSGFGGRLARLGARGLELFGSGSLAAPLSSSPSSSSRAAGVGAGPCVHDPLAGRIP